MSSRDIAEVCGKRHDHVIRDIERMLSALQEDSPNLGDHAKSITYVKDARGYTSAIHLPKRETLILVSCYDVRFRAKIIDRSAEREAVLEEARPTMEPQSNSREPKGC